MMKLANKKLQKYYNLTSEVYMVAIVMDPALKLAYHQEDVRTSSHGRRLSAGDSASNEGQV